MTKKTDKYRKSSAKGTSTEVPRTGDGVAVPVERYEPGNAQVGTDISGFYRFTLEELDFLDKYAECKADLNQIAALTGLAKKRLSRMMEKDSIRAEITELQNVWRLNRKMTAEHAAADHIELMRQLKQDYMEGDLDLRAKMANPRVKASETYLKAAGHFNHGGETQDSNVVINIDLGGNEVEVSKGSETAKVKKSDG